MNLAEEHYKDVSIRTKLFGVFGLISAFIVVAAIITILFSGVLIKNYVGNLSARVAESVLDGIDVHIFSRIEELHIMTDQRSVNDLLVHSNNVFDAHQNRDQEITNIDAVWKAHSDLEAFPFARSILENAISEQFRYTNADLEILNEHNVFGEIFLTNRYGVNVAMSGYTTDYFQADEGWWQKAKEHGFHIGDVEFDDSAGIYSVDISLRVSDFTGAFAGVVKGSLNISEIRDIVNEHEGENNVFEVQDIHIVAANGDVLISNRFDFLENISHKSLFRKTTGITDSTGDRFFVLEDEERKELVGYAISRGYKEFPGLGWYLFLTSPTDVVFKQVETIRNIILTIIVLLIALIAFLSELIYKTITRPLTSLKQAAQSVAAGDFSTNIPVVSKDEIGLVSEAFNEMIVSLQQAQSGLSEEKNKLFYVTENMNAGALLVDEDGSTVFANRKIKSILALEDNIRDEAFIALASYFPNVDVFSYLRTCNVKRPEIVSEVNHDHNIYEMYVQCIPKKHEDGVVGHLFLIRDVTDQRMLEHSKRDFVSIASHQLRTPLTSIRLFSEMLANGSVGKLSPTQQEYVENIQTPTLLMIDLVNDLLDESRLQAGTIVVSPVEFELKEFLEKMLSEVTLMGETKKAVLSLNIDDLHSETICTDKTLLRQIVRNYLTNALRYTKKDKGEVVLSAKTVGDHVEISVADNGIGIAKKDKRNIFKKFFRADRAVKKETSGTGLGLHVSKMLAELLEAKVWFESEEDVGTTFYVSIPNKHSKCGSKHASG